jgi:hypothetical protein
MSTREVTMKDRIVAYVELCDPHPVRVSEIAEVLDLDQRQVRSNGGHAAREGRLFRPEKDMFQVGTRPDYKRKRGTKKAVRGHVVVLEEREDGQLVIRDSRGQLYIATPVSPVYRTADGQILE